MWRRWPQKSLNFGPCDRTITARSSKAWSIASEICCAIGMEGPTALPAPADATQSRGPLAVASGHTPNLADTTACRARLIPKLGARTTRRLIFVGRMRHSVRASPALSKCWSPSGQNRIIRSPDFGAPVCSPVCPRNSPNSLAVSPSEGLPGNTVCVYLVTAMLSYEGATTAAQGGEQRGTIENQEAFDRRQRAQDLDLT